MLAVQPLVADQLPCMNCLGDKTTVWPLKQYEQEVANRACMDLGSKVRVWGGALTGAEGVGGLGFGGERALQGDLRGRAQTALVPVVQAACAHHHLPLLQLRFCTFAVLPQHSTMHKTPLADVDIIRAPIPWSVTITIS